MMFRTFIKKIDGLLARGMMSLIRGYQKTFSADHSFLGKLFPFMGCKYFPSCSDYAILTLQEFGFFRGMVRIVSRVGRCNPWSDGGVDFPSEASEKQFRCQNHCEKESKK